MLSPAAATGHSITYFNDCLLRRALTNHRTPRALPPTELTVAPSRPPFPRRVPALAARPRSIPGGCNPAAGAVRPVTTGAAPASPYLPPPAPARREPTLARTANGPNRRAAPLAAKPGTQPGACAHLQARPLPVCSTQPRPPRVPPGPHASQSPPAGRAAHRHGPRERRGVTARGVLARLPQPRGPAQARGGKQRLAPAAPPQSQAPALPAPGTLRSAPCDRLWASAGSEVPTPPPRAGAAGPAAAHWLQQLLGDEQPRPALVGWGRGAASSPPKNPKKKKSLSLETRACCGRSCCSGTCYALGFIRPPSRPSSRWPFGAPGLGDGGKVEGPECFTVQPRFPGSTPAPSLGAQVKIPEEPRALVKVEK